MADASARRDQGFSWKYYWSVDIPGLTEGQAQSLLDCCPDLSGTAVDPRQWFTVHMDRETAEVLRTALLDLERNSIGVGLREIVEDWLDSTVPEVHEE
jgi:hypothetical protein